MSDVFETNNNFDSGTMNVPVPEYVAEEEEDVKDLEFNSEDILQAILSVNEEGHSPSFITASLERIKNVKEGMTLADVADEDREYVDQMQIEYCAVDIDTLDGELMQVILSFDSPNDAYLEELNEFMHRYKIMQREIAAAEDESQIPLMSLTFAPEELQGFGILQFSFPVMYTRCLNDAGTNAAMVMLFHIGNMEFAKINISDEDLTELKANIYREVEAGTGGALFEE